MIQDSGTHFEQTLRRMAKLPEMTEETESTTLTDDERKQLAIEALTNKPKVAFSNQQDWNKQDQTPIVEAANKLEKFLKGIVES